MLQLKQDSLASIIMIGDKILIKPNEPSQKLDSGLYLPQGIHKKQSLHMGYIMKVGPGFPIPRIEEENEVWKEKKDGSNFIPLQCEVGDLAVYLREASYELILNNEPYVILGQSSIIMLIRDDQLFEV